ncbi:hypothetical protein L9F63_000635, partial [Diploptera punctata]
DRSRKDNAAIIFTKNYFDSLKLFITKIFILWLRQWSSCITLQYRRPFVVIVSCFHDCQFFLLFAVLSNQGTEIGMVGTCTPNVIDLRAIWWPTDKFPNQSSLLITGCHGGIMKYECPIVTESE